MSRYDPDHILLEANIKKMADQWDLEKIIGKIIFGDGQSQTTKVQEHRIRR